MFEHLISLSVQTGLSAYVATVLVGIPARLMLVSLFDCAKLGGGQQWDDDGDDVRVMIYKWNMTKDVLD